MGGLKKNSEDYNYVYQKFWKDEAGYDIDNYDGEAIWKSRDMPHFRDDYDLKQFKQSLYRMTSLIREARNNEAAPQPAAVQAPPPPPPPQQQQPQQQQQPAPFASPPRGVARPGTPVSTAKNLLPVVEEELTPNDEYLLDVPHHLIEWKDKQQNKRLTLIVYLPSGVKKGDVAPRIVAGGTQVVMEMDWPAPMMDVRLPMYAGTQSRKPYYANGHVKVSNFNESVKHLKNHDADRTITSVFRKELSHPVEEQFCDFDVPDSLYSVTFQVKPPMEEDGVTPMKGSDGRDLSPQDCVAVVLEMMCVRSNYGVSHEIEDFTLDFDNLAI